MSAQLTKAELTEQLKAVEAEIVELRSSSAGVTASLGTDGDGVENSEDIAAELTNLQENEGILSLLEQRRDSLQERLDAQGS